jgi:hypothetical protein
MNYIPCQQADSTGSLAERSAHNDNDDGKDTTRRKIIIKAVKCMIIKLT